MGCIVIVTASFDWLFPFFARSELVRPARDSAVINWPGCAWDYSFADFVGFFSEG